LRHYAAHASDEQRLWKRDLGDSDCTSPVVVQDLIGADYAKS